MIIACFFISILLCILCFCLGRWFEARWWNDSLNMLPDELIEEIKKELKK